MSKKFNRHDLSKIQIQEKAKRRHNGRKRTTRRNVVKEIKMNAVKRRYRDRKRQLAGKYE